VIYLIFWQQRTFPHPDTLIFYLARMFNVEPLIIRLLLYKNIKTEEDIQKFLFPSSEQFHDPFLLNDMEISVERILKAIANHETILVFGDYDTDGVTSTTLLYKALCFFGADVYYYVPLREEGYGISAESVLRLKYKHNPRLIVTVDNGSSAHDAIEQAASFGIDVIVTDHHDILKGHPTAAYSFINPKRTDSTYPFNDLCGAGVALKLVHALFIKKNIPFEKYMWDYIELASIGTIGDMVKLIDENRAIASLGIRKLSINPSLFFKELFKKIKLQRHTITGTSIAFQIVPILNSCGRIYDANYAISLLIKKEVESNEIDYLVELNQKRKEMTIEQFLIAERDVLKSNSSLSNIILSCDDYHSGLIGLISSRLSEKFSKPSVVINYQGKGSCRSGPNPDFSIIRAISQCGHLLKTYGGHKGAAGLSIDLENIDAFQTSLQEAVSSEKTEQTVMYYDLELPIMEFPTSLLEDLKLLEPCGMGNEKPIFYSPYTTFSSILSFGKQNEHLKFLSDEIELLSFSKGELLSDLKYHDHFHLIYTPDFDKGGRFIAQDIILNKKDFLNETIKKVHSF
jgi:single-stranded-DNA-specific exonuclease